MYFFIFFPVYTNFGCVSLIYNYCSVVSIPACCTNNYQLETLTSVPADLTMADLFHTRLWTRWSSFDTSLLSHMLSRWWPLVHLSTEELLLSYNFPPLSCMFSSVVTTWIPKGYWCRTSLATTTSKFTAFNKSPLTELVFTEQQGLLLINTIAITVSIHGAVSSQGSPGGPL